jgi:hypothetical protein
MDTFWKWLISGSGASRPGWRNIIGFPLLFHFGVAGVLMLFLKSDPFAFAGKALFPAASILVGMSLAWTTRAATVLQNKDFRERLFNDGRPAEDYIYGYQLAILIIITMISYVAIMAGGGLSIVVFGSRVDTAISGFVLYSLLSLSIRECWGVVNFTNMLSMLDYRR